jgi:hypothetical protein
MQEDEDDLEIMGPVCAASGKQKIYLVLRDGKGYSRLLQARQGRTVR